MDDSTLANILLFLASSDLKLSEHKVFLCLLVAFLKGEELTSIEISEITGRPVKGVRKTLISLGRKDLAKRVFVTQKLYKKSPQFLYFIRSNNHVKIGISSNVSERIEELQRGNPIKLEILGVIKNSSFKKEEEIHNKFINLRTVGEWFKYENSIAEYINKNSSKLEKTTIKETPKTSGSDRWGFIIPDGIKETKQGQKYPKRSLQRNTTPSSDKSQSITKLRIRDIYNKNHDSEDDIRNKTSEIHSYESKNPKEKKKKADERFKELVDRIFIIYEKETRKKLNPLFGAADGKAVKRLLENLPEENVERLCESFLNFLRTDDDFDYKQISRGPVRYWATRVYAFLPERQFDVEEGYRRKHGKKNSG